MREHRLNSGYNIPVIGVGTWQVEDEACLTRALECGYKAGYRHIDTATNYRNEQYIGNWLKDKNRGELFITSKLWKTDHGRVREACRESLEKLRTDYLDLYLIHWPECDDGELDLARLWGDMEALVDAGMVRGIGLSNFSIEKIEKVLSVCRIKPAALQVEMHPYLPQASLRKFCAEHGIQVIAYSSLGSSGKADSVRDDPVIRELAEKHGTSVACILLGYGIALGACVIPRSGSPEHICSNLNTASLSDEDMAKIGTIKKRVRYIGADSKLFKGVPLD